MKLKLAKEKNRWHLEWSNETNSYVQFYPPKATYLNDKKLTVSSLAIYSSGVIVSFISLAILALCTYNKINTMHVLSFSFGGLLFICFQFNEKFDGWFSDTELFTKDAFSWVGGSTLGSYFVSATASHYEWAMKKIRAHQKNC